MKKFQKNIEDFICENCGFSVEGDGYTNHCPKCLHSKHVDVNPGDRAESCGGTMIPVGIELKKKDYVIIHQCKKCLFKRKNKARDEDMKAIIEFSKKVIFDF